MEMNQIRYFLAVCEHRNFTHAAKASNVSQPSLTASIKKLEEELGGPLFLRDRAGCRLTPLGTLLRPRLENVQREIREAKSETIRHIRLDRVPICIGIGETIGQSKVVEAIERLRIDLPEADVELLVDDQKSLLEGLRKGRLDIAIMATDASPDLYKIDPLYSESYRVVVATDHPLSEQESVSLELLEKTDMLDRPNCEMRDALHRTCEESGHTLYAAYRSNRVDWLLQLARMGSGAVILPETAIPTGTGLTSLPIKGLEIGRQVFALRHRHQPSRPETQALLKNLMQ